jgi:CRISPR-associated protein Csm3
MTALSRIEFKKRIFISGTLTVLTGLHIGGNSTEMSIGGADHIVVRDPLTNYPYIPGSSLRGKMRSLLERLTGEMTINIMESNKVLKHVSELGDIMAEGVTLNSAGPSASPSQLSTRLFGLPIDKQNGYQIEDIVPQRLVVRDAQLKNPATLEKARNTDMPMTEVKTEVAIDRITSQANPRQIERVPAGAEFDFEMILNLYGADDENEYIKAVFGCMDLLQDDYLGGHGSRGYGKVRFSVNPIMEKSAEDYRNNHSAKPASTAVPDTLKQ